MLSEKFINMFSNAFYVYNEYDDSVTCQTIPYFEKLKTILLNKPKQHHTRTQKQYSFGKPFIFPRGMQVEYFTGSPWSPYYGLPQVEISKTYHSNLNFFISKRFDYFANDSLTFPPIVARTLDYKGKRKESDVYRPFTPFVPLYQPFFTNITNYEDDDN